MSTEFQEYIDRRFDRLEAATLIGAKPILTADEASLYTGYSLKNIYVLTSTKQIPHFKKGKKLYFKKSELDEWMTESRVMTQQEINSRAETYTVTHKRHKL